MKKLVLLLSAIVILSGCAGSDDLETLKKENEELKSKLEQYEGTLDQEDINVSTESGDKNIKYETKEYVWKSSPYNCITVVYKNTSSDPVYADVSFALKDDNGNIVGVEESTVGVVLPGKERLAEVYTDTEFKNYDMKVIPHEMTLDTSYVDESILKVDIKPTNGKFIISASNNGDKPVRVEQDSVLYFKDGKVVDSGLSEIGGSLSTIDPADTVYSESEITGKDFDEYKYYYTAYYDD